MKVYAAPLQGYTENLWRRFHHEVYGPGVEAYYSPFLRMEKGDVRRKDLRDIDPEATGGYRLIPQIIFKDRAEFSHLVERVAGMGYGEIDLNLGCPFPLQTAKGRGVALLRRPEVLDEVAEEMGRRQDVTFSVKMRLGMERPDEWKGIIASLNRLPLSRVVMHPRTGRQGYTGELDYDSFGEFLRECSHPVVFNGGILSLEDCRTIEAEHPAIEGLMIGRGLLARPSLVAELTEGSGWPREKRMEFLRRFYERLSDAAEQRYCGESQLLSKLKPFWEYLEPEIGRRALKAINKAGNMIRYKSAVAAALEG